MLQFLVSSKSPWQGFPPQTASLLIVLLRFAQPSLILHSSHGPMTQSSVNRLSIGWHVDFYVCWQNFGVFTWSIVSLICQKNKKRGLDHIPPGDNVTCLGVTIVNGSSAYPQTYTSGLSDGHGFSYFSSVFMCFHNTAIFLYILYFYFHFFLVFGCFHTICIFGFYWFLERGYNQHWYIIACDMLIFCFK